jgi:predicted O-methyltransferase YrrM
MVSKYDLLKHFAKLGFKVGAEIGVSQGYFSEAMFKAIPDLKLYCIDAWKSYPGVRRWMPNQQRAETYFEIAKKRLASYNAEIIREMSMDAVKMFADNSLDFVFIDANHGFDYVMEDLINWTKKVRVGGIVSGDDYYHFKKAGVVEAVDLYTKMHNIKFELTNPLPYKIIDRKAFEQPVFYWTKT